MVTHILIIILVFGYVFRPSSECVCNKKSVAELQSIDIIEQFETDEKQANENYLGKVITVKGEIASVSSDDSGKTVVELKSKSIGNVSCTFCKNESPDSFLKQGNTVSIKGQCVGFTFDVVLIKCCLAD